MNERSMQAGSPIKFSLSNDIIPFKNLGALSDFIFGYGGRKKVGRWERSSSEISLFHDVESKRSPRQKID